MRALRAVPARLVAFVTLAILVLAIPAIASAYSPATSYPWAQPGAITVAPDVWAQQPASVTISVGATSSAPSLAPQFGAGYHWAQLPANIPAG